MNKSAANSDKTNRLTEADTHAESHLESSRLSDFPDGNLDGNAPEQKTEAQKGGRSMEDATDPSKLSDL